VLEPEHVIVHHRVTPVAVARAATAAASVATAVTRVAIVIRIIVICVVCRPTIQLLLAQPPVDGSTLTGACHFAFDWKLVRHALAVHSNLSHASARIHDVVPAVNVAIVLERDGLLGSLKVASLQCGHAEYE